MQEAVSRSRYLVRRLEPSDSASFFGAVRASLPGLVDAMPWCRLDYAIEDAEAWIRFTQSCWENRSEFPLGVFEAETGQVIGGVGVNQINHAHRIGNIGYWVSTPHHGRGIARFAAREAAMLGFGELGLARLEIVTLPPAATSNSPSRGRVKIPQLSARDGWMVTRSPDGSQREPPLL